MPRWTWFGPGERLRAAPYQDSLPAREIWTGANCASACGARLASLSPQAAEIFALRFLEGHSNLEIARMLAMSQVLGGGDLAPSAAAAAEGDSSYIGEKL